MGGKLVLNKGEKEEEEGWNQLVGSILEWVKKVAVVGSPMPSMWGMCLSRKWGGISLGIACPSAIINIMESFTTSDRTSRIVAIKLWRVFWNWVRKRRDLGRGEGERRGWRNVPWFGSIPPKWDGNQGDSFLCCQLLFQFIQWLNLSCRSVVNSNINKVRFILCCSSMLWFQRKGTGKVRNLMFKCKMKGRKKEIQFQIFAGCRIDQISFLPCIHQHLLSLEPNKQMRIQLYTKREGGCNGKYILYRE